MRCRDRVAGLRRHAVGHSNRVTATSSVSRAVASAAVASARTVVGSLVDANHAAVKLDIVHGSDGVLGMILLGVADKAEAAAATGIAILHHDRFLDMTIFLEFLAESRLFGVPGQATDEELGHDGR